LPLLPKGCPKKGLGPLDAKEEALLPFLVPSVACLMTASK
jgi:hypothetical protein